LAGLGTGVIDKPERIKEWVDFRPTIKVNQDNHHIYDQYYSIYRELYENTKATMKKLADI
ncbi:MAG: hypothetical protein RBS14_06110, partial [Atribacterota bacterium]|nr:hypothetical protein [Atribacterota bacterium]